MIDITLIQTLFEDVSTALVKSFYMANIIDTKDEAGEEYAIYNLINENMDSGFEKTESWTAVGANDTKVTTEIKSEPIISLNFMSNDELAGEVKSRNLARNTFNLLMGITDPDFDFKGLYVQMISPSIENRTEFLGKKDGGGYEYRYGFDIKIDYRDIIENTIESINTTIMTGTPEGDGNIPYDPQTVTATKP